MDPSAILKIWPHCFTLDFYGHDSGPVFRAVGTNFCGYYSGKLANLPVSDLIPGTLTALSSHFFEEVLEKNAPVSQGGTIDNPDGSHILNRSILLRMSDDAENISGFLGAAKCCEKITVEAKPVNIVCDAPPVRTAEYDYEII